MPRICQTDVAPSALGGFFRPIICYSDQGILQQRVQVMGNDRYGNRRVPKMYAEINELRRAIANEGTDRIQEAWEKVEEHIDFAYQQNAQASSEALAMAAAPTHNVFNGSCSPTEQAIDNVAPRLLSPFMKEAARTDGETWQAIQGAPRDGTEFLTFGRQGFAIVRWIDMSWADVETQRWFPVDDFSHWMPLPKPPVPKESINPPQDKVKHE